MSMVALPTSADPTINPWQYAHDVLYREMYPTPSPGFERRVIAVICVLIYSGFAAAALLVVNRIKSKRSKGEGLWIYRLVETGKGRLIVGNNQVLTDLSTIMYMPYLIGHAVAPYRMMAHHTSQSGLMAWITGFLPYSYFFGYAIMTSAVQAWFLVSGKARFPFLSTQIINGFFFGVGGTVLSSLIILAAFADHYWKAAWSEFVRLEDMLLSQAPLWNGTTVDETAWNAATAIMRTRYGHIVQFRLVMKVLLGFFAPTMVILALTLLAPIIVLSLLHRQLRESKGVKFRTTTTVTSPVVGNTLEGFIDPQQERIQDLERAEREYFGFTLSNIFIAFCILTIMMWWFVNFQKFRKLDWPRQEAILFIQCWWWGILFSVVSTIRLYFDIRHLRSVPAGSSTRLTVSVSIGVDVAEDSELELGESLGKEQSRRIRRSESEEGSSRRSGEEVSRDEGRA